MICPYCFESMDGLKKIYDTLVLLYVIKLIWLGIKCPIKVKFDLWSYKGLIYMDGVIYLFVICHWVAIWVMVQLTNLYCIMWPKFFMNHKWQIQSHLVLLCVSIEITILIWLRSHQSGTVMINCRFFFIEFHLLLLFIV